LLQLAVVWYISCFFSLSLVLNISLQITVSY